jgi:hypothetical protein
MIWKPVCTKPEGCEEIEVAPHRSTPWWLPWLLFAFLLALYCGFPSRRYDGDALKQSGVFHSIPAIGGSNHPFSAMYFRTWWNLIKGFAGEDFVRRMDLLVAMNSLLGAGAAALGCAWLGRQGLDARVTLPVGLLLGLSHFWIYHSTQTTEPMAAQFLLMLSLWVGSLSRLGVWRLILSGALWATAVVSYQSYFLAGPFVLWFAVNRWRSLPYWVLPAGFAGFFWFGLAASLSGARDLSGFLSYLTAKHDGDYWGFLRWSQTLRVPIGLALSIAIPWPFEPWPGVRLGFPRLSPVEKILMTVQILVTWGLALTALVLPVRSALRRLRWGLLLGFVVTLFPPIYLLPLYGKIWLLPTSLLVLLAGLVASSYRWGPHVLLSVVALQLTVNVPRSPNRPHDPSSSGLHAARAIREVLLPEDLLICDGWDDSGTFCAMYAQQNTVVLMFSKGGPEPVWNRVRETLAAGHRAYVYGVIERTAEEWMLTDLGTRPGLVTHAEFKSFRDRVSSPVWTAREKGCAGDLYQILKVP